MPGKKENLPQKQGRSKEEKAVLNDLFSIAEVAVSSRYIALGSGAELNAYTGCSWEQFLDELAQKGPLWSQVLAAFQDALARLDFKPVWKSEELEELVWQAATEED